MCIRDSVNVVGGGNIDGPSAGLGIFLSIYSAFKEWPIPQNIAVTGELSIRGKVYPVGGIAEKIYGAKQAGVKKVILPYDNLGDVPKGCLLYTSRFLVVREGE